MGEEWIDDDFDVFNEVLHFNLQRRLISKGYKETKELAMILSELVELLESDDFEAKVDGYADAIVFAIGAIAKLGYNPKGILFEVCTHINSEVGGKFDEEKQKYIKGTRQYQTNFKQHKIK